MQMHWSGVLKALRKGWCKGKLIDCAGNVCLRGAVHVASPATYYSYEMERLYLIEMAEVIKEQYPHRSYEIGKHPELNVVVMFNNHPDTTKDDVLLVAEKAALRSQERVIC